MKVLIWILAVCGLALPALIAIVRLGAPQPNTAVGQGAGSDWLVSSVGIYVGRYPLELSTSKLPAVLVLLGVGLLLVGLYQLLPQHAR